MPHRDLQIIKEYFEQLSTIQEECREEIQTIVNIIGQINDKCSSITTSVTLPRKTTISCTICNKRVVPDG
jgi:hypothetical protein